VGSRGDAAPNDLYKDRGPVRLHDRARRRLFRRKAITAVVNNNPKNSQQSGRGHGLLTIVAWHIAWTGLALTGAVIVALIVGGEPAARTAFYGILQSLPALPVVMLLTLPVNFALALATLRLSRRRDSIRVIACFALGAAAWVLVRILWFPPQPGSEPSLSAAITVGAAVAGGLYTLPISLRDQRGSARFA
jgi:hypothetical protein